MSTPTFALLGFALWTVLILSVTIGYYRWSRILTGRSRPGEWTADPNVGADWYRRAMRAHLNAVENLPVFGAIVYAVDQSGVRSPWVDGLALFVLGARVVHSLVHITLVQTDVVATVRFSFFFLQILGMIGMVVAMFLAL
ncbi:MAG: MAPEG family protein [Deltaproteobacteria bacterium]|nr:MAG: MAPEG family protein [Deltaproteobacteria bacterium]